MIEILTRAPLVGSLGRLYRRAAALVSGWMDRQDRGGLVLKVCMGAFLTGLGMLFVGNLSDHRGAEAGEGGAVPVAALPSIVPVVSQGIGVLLASVGFLASLCVGARTRHEKRRFLVVLSLTFAAFAVLAAWLPTDVVATRAAILGKAPAGETPSIPAYLGMLLLVSLLVLSIPVVALLYFRLGLMDRYVIRNFLAPFALCLASFISISLLHDITDNGDLLAKLSFGEVVALYAAMVPFVVLFALPVASLLSALHALGRMSKANEFISMVGAGRSVPRILAPVIAAAAYASLIGLACKYQWAPAAVGYKKAVEERLMRGVVAQGRGGTDETRDLWGRRGWMHMNEIDRRNWFVGRVPLNLSDEMGDIIVTQNDERDQPVRMWIAQRAKWVWDAAPPVWILTGVRVYDYGSNHIPTIRSEDRVEIHDWSETPWKVLSSSQNPDYLGIPGLSMYLNAHRGLDDRALAPFRTSRWQVFAEPFSCLALVLVAAPLGIVYSRRGAMAGVTGAVACVALMYVMSHTFVALGKLGRMPPFAAAWTTNFVIIAIGLTLLWYRARNRELPSLKTLLPRRAR